VDGHSKFIFVKIQMISKYNHNHVCEVGCFFVDCPKRLVG